MMESTNPVDLMFERIMSMHIGNPDLSREKSHYRLFREHERRVALWSKALGFPPDAQPVMWDIATVIIPSVAVEEEKLRALSKHTKDHYTHRIFQNALKWTAIQDSPEARRYNLPAPYEPLVMLYERGGDVYKDEVGHAWFVTRATLFPMMHEYYDRTTPIVELDTATLDAIDAGATNKYSLTRGEFERFNHPNRAHIAKEIMMESTNPVDQLFERIMSIDFSNEDLSRFESHYRLFREHERRVALWSKSLGFPREAQSVMWDIASAIIPSVAVEEEKIQTLAKAVKGSLYTLRIFQNALKWTAIQDSPEARRYNLPAPYEPLVMLYERGGIVYKGELGRAWFVTNGELSPAMHEYYDHTTPIVELDTAILDAIDAGATNK